MTAQIERTLQTDIAWRLNRYPIVYASIPNSIYIPTREKGERDMAARIINRLKTDGMFTPGAADMVLIGPKGGLYLELKRAASRDLFTVRPKGRLSPVQREFQSRCAAAGVRYVVAHCWDDIEPCLGELF
jgi:hypothetical protein